MRGFFVIGTDTGVGKTQVSVALLRLGRRAGLQPAGLKPAETGCQDQPEDAVRLQAEAGGTDPLEWVCPFQLRAPLAPAVAARLEGRTLSFETVLDRARALTAGDRPLVVESAGGLLVPFTEHQTNADLARAFGLPIVLVARAGLGTINHTALTLEALERRGLPVRAVILNRTTARGDLSEATNPAEVARLTTAPVIGPLPFEISPTARLDAHADLLGRTLDFA